MKLVLHCFSSDENWKGNCELAVVEIDAEYLKLIKARATQIIDLRLKDNGVEEIDYQDARCEYYEDAYEDVTEEESSKFEDRGWVILKGELTLPDSQRTEVDRMVLDVGVASNEELAISVYWKTYPKHDNVLITTQSVTIRELEEALNG